MSKYFAKSHSSWIDPFHRMFGSKYLLKNLHEFDLLRGEKHICPSNQFEFPCDVDLWLWLAIEIEIGPFSIQVWVLGFHSCVRPS